MSWLPKKKFGELYVIRGIIYYRLSPNEMKPFAGVIKYGIPNMIPRTLSTMYTWLPVFVLGYVAQQLIDEYYRRSKRKNPRDYMFEVEPPRCPPKT